MAMMTGRKRMREAAVVAGMLLTAIIALRIIRQAPGRAVGARPRHPAHRVARRSPRCRYVARGIAGVAGRYVELAHGVRADNERAVRRTRQLRAELVEMRRLADESGRYQRLLGLRDETPAETIAARIIAIDASPYFRVARVEHRSRRGDVVKRGMPVLTPEGVVGSISHVSGKTSDVMLLVDPRSALDVRRSRAPAAAASCAASRATTATAATSNT